MSDAAVKTLPAGEAFDIDLVVGDFAQDLSGDRRARHNRGADLDTGVAGNQKHLVEGDGGLTFLEVAEIHFKTIARLYFELGAAVFNNCVGHVCLQIAPPGGVPGGKSHSMDDPGPVCKTLGFRWSEIPPIRTSCTLA
jgi:hypothetical protein